MSGRNHRTAAARDRRGAFTLLEILLAIAILGAVSTITFMAFGTVTQAWRRGITLTDNLHHGDFVIEQLVMGLRSAYYAENKGGSSPYGFLMEDNGDGPYDSDVISWVKLGTALVGSDCPFAGSPHRVKVAVEQDDDGRSAVSLRAWRLHGQPEDFDPEEDVETVFLATRITGLDCKTAYRRVESEGSQEEEIEWLDEWEETNRLPTMVQIVLHLEPMDDDGEPIEIKRILDVPVGPLSW